MQITTLLTLSTLYGALSTIVPAVSYLTKLDIYVIICILHVFFILIEFPIVLAIKRRGHMELVNRIEKHAKVFFAFSLIMFNMIYWIYISQI